MGFCQAQSLPWTKNFNNLTKSKFTFERESKYSIKLTQNQTFPVCFY